MLSRINILLLVVAIILQFDAIGQTVSRAIRWDAVSKTYTDAKGAKIVMPYFAGAQVSESNGYVPYYGENISIPQYGPVTATLADEVYETVTDPAVKSTKIPASITLQVAPGMIRKKAVASVYLPTLRRNMQTGQIERLTRFSIQLSVSGTRQLQATQSYAGTSVLASGTWYKVGVTSTAVYKLDYNFLKTNCGFDLGSTDFSSIAVFGNGGGMVPDLNAVARYDDLQENPTYIVDNNGNNKVDQGDYILFYAQGPDSWAYDSTSAHFAFTKNLYTDTNYYFVTSNKGTGKRVSTVPSLSSPARTITQFDDYAAHQIDQYNLLNSGKIWLGDRMSTLNPTTAITFSFPNITSAPVYFASYAAAASPYSSTISASVGGRQILSHQISPLVTTDYTDAFHTDAYSDGLFDIPAAKVSGTFTAGSSAFTVTYTFNNPDVNGTSDGYIYNLTLNATRALSFTGNYMLFRSLASVGSGNSQFTISGATAAMQLWDITDITAIQAISPTTGAGSAYVTTGDHLREFAAVDPGGTFSTPAAIGPVSTQNLHAIGQPNMLIITPDDLMAASNDLAAYHSQHDRLSVKVVPLEQVYNEFGSGKPDISAIRDFVRMVYDKAGNDSAKLPNYLLLMGDGSFDPKNRTSDNNNQFPTYQSKESYNILVSYVTDDYFGCLDANEGGDMNNNNQKVDIAIGRIPAADQTEAEGMVAKIKLYKSTATQASWRNIVTFVADEPWLGEYDFQTEADHLGELMRTTYPAYNVDKIYTDAYPLVSTPGGGRYPDVNTAILNRINTGTLIMGYTGHGGPSNWANARIFNLSDIQNLQNAEKLPLFVTATCDFSRFDNPVLKTAGEFLMTNAKGGAISMITTVRPVYEGPNEVLQNELFPFLFSTYSGRRPTMGEAMQETKNAVLGANTMNTREFLLLGDPALTLNYPQYNVVTTAIDNIPLSQPHDSLKALKYVTISGEVRDANGVRMTSFTGTCYPLVYDKLTTFNTLPNVVNGITYNVSTFNTYKSPIFKGQCSITNGVFSFSFIVPKDINYAVGYGRISYYATNVSTDANGYQNDIVVGGASDTVYNDKQGPKIKLYMNDERFVYGGITDANPKLLAELSDTSGINTTGNGLGHDLTAILDANSKNPIILNDYYQSALNNFRRGTVSYPFTNLADGAHTLKMKAWDILDNSSEDNTEFIVASSAKLALQHVYNYPNPFTTRTEFMFEHNRPGQELKIQVQIYSVSGKIVKTIQTDELSTGYRVDDIRWDGLDDYGDKIGKGVYIYKVHVVDQQGNSANQFQKLVVLR